MDREQRKKEEEKKILAMVFKKEFVDKNSVSSETPDFIIHDVEKNLKTGVEIVRIFPNQASAVQYYKPNFHFELILDYYTSKKKQKKIEKFSKNLSLIEVIGDAVVPGPTILWKKSLLEFYDFFEGLLNTKSESYKKLKNGLVSVTIIAYDASGYLDSINIKVGQLYGTMRQHSIFKKIIDSVFMDQILLAKFKEGLFHISLRRLIFFSEFAIFQDFWNTLILESGIKEDLFIKFNNFIICLLFLGFKNIYLYSDTDHRYIVFGKTYWKINKETGLLKEQDFLTLNYNELVTAEDQLKNWKNYPHIFDKYEKFRNDFIPVLDSGYFHRHR